MKKFIIAMMSVLFLIVGCQVEVIENSSEDNSVAEFIAISESFDGNTKTTLGKDNNILWSQGDQLAIFQGCNIADKYQVTDATAGTGQGVFSIVSDESGSINGDFSAGMEIATNIAFYPYMESLSCSKNNVNNSTSEVTSYNIDNIILPEVQYYAENSFCNGSFPMVAVTEGLKDHTLKFKNVLGAIKLQLKGSQTVKSIMITGKNNEKLSGAATVSAYSNSLTPAITMTGDEESAKSVTLDCGVGVQLDESVATDFIISLPPVLFSHGFTVIVVDNEEQTYTITASTPNTILRSSILGMPVVTLGEEPGDSDEGNDELVIPVTTVDLNYSSLKIYESFSSQITATVRPKDATNKTVVWSSSHPNVATVDQTGRVAGISVGTATISAVVGDIITTCTVTVKMYNPIDYVDDQDVNFLKGVAIGGTIWAPVNCGYEPANGEYKGYPYGKLYQWGRKFGQGYDENDATTPTLETGGVSAISGSHKTKQNVFFTSGYDWTDPANNQLWNTGTEQNPVKSEYDPCPDGWRVPTFEELDELRQNCSEWITNEKGQNGYWFSGTNSYSVDVPQIFLPAAGYRGAGDGDVSSRCDEGCYWSSKPHSGAAEYLRFRIYGTEITYHVRAQGYSIRCVQE